MKRSPVQYDTITLPNTGIVNIHSVKRGINPPLPKWYGIDERKTRAYHLFLKDGMTPELRLLSAVYPDSRDAYCNMAFSKGNRTLDVFEEQYANVERIIKECFGDDKSDKVSGEDVVNNKKTKRNTAMQKKSAKKPTKKVAVKKTVAKKAAKKPTKKVAVKKAK